MTRTARAAPPRTFARAGLRTASRRDLPTLERLFRLAYASEAANVERAVAGTPPRYMRMWRDRLATSDSGTITLIPMGQYFGGRRVECVGVQAVAVAPEARSAGAAGRMMTEALRAMAAGGAAISTLYASVQSLYRQLGYEHAGVLGELRIGLRMLPRRGPGPRLVPLPPRRDAEIRALYEPFAGLLDGYASRDVLLWSRIRCRRGREYEGFGVPSTEPRMDAALDGYFFVDPQIHGDDRLVDISDLAFRTACAGRAILRALSDYAPTMTTALLHVGPTHPLVSLLEQQWHEWRIRDLWMVRIVDLPRAVTQRGYRDGVDASLRIALDDNVLPHHAGEWVIEIRGGRGRARRPRRTDHQPILSVSPRGLATVWSSFLSPWQARLQELIRGSEEALTLAAAIFAGPTASMTDRF